jgi:hypothetical protein
MLSTASRVSSLPRSSNSAVRQIIAKLSRFENERQGAIYPGIGNTLATGLKTITQDSGPQGRYHQASHLNLSAEYHRGFPLYNPAVGSQFQTQPFMNFHV